MNRAKLFCFSKNMPEDLPVARPTVFASGIPLPLLPPPRKTPSLNLTILALKREKGEGVRLND